MTENTEVKETSVSIETLTGNSLVNVDVWKKKIQEAKDNNPVIEITDNATYEAEKKARTNVKTVRVEIDKQDKVIASAFTKIRKETMDIRDTLLGEITPFEELHQAEVEKWEKQLEEKRLAKEREEQDRIDGIKNKISEIESASYEYINSVDFSKIDEGYEYLEKTCDNPDFDFQEYDILWQQARERVIEYYNNKVSNLKEKEQQRAENERLAKENEESKKREALQSERLEKLYPVIAFTKDVKLMELHTYSEDLFKNILREATEAKEESQRKANEEFDRQEKERKEREEKDRAEKEKIFEVRKQRLLSLGTLENEKEFYINLSKTSTYAIFKGDVYTFDEILFEKCIQDLKNFEKDAKEQKEKDSKLNKENESRQKAMKGEKNKFESYIDSLEFSAIIPDLKNEELKDFHLKVLEEVSEFKNHMKTKLKNL